MQVIEGPSAAERALPFLMEREAVNNLMVGILRAPPEGLFVAAAIDAGRVVAVGLRTAIKYGLSASADPGAPVLLAEHAWRRLGDLPGWVGPVAEAMAFGEVWARLTGRAGRLARRLRIYQLDEVVPAIRAPGTLRLAMAADHGKLSAWCAAFAAEAGTEDATPAEVVGRHIANGNLFVWEDGEVVSMAAHGGWTPHGGRISLVYTPPALRGRGYASACVAAASARLLAEGRRFCFLYTDLANPTSNRIYQAIGYRPVCDVDDYRLDGPQV